ncbi:MAG: gliding motility-associated C-terminal domain-containing protein [Bacteroidia bacterium]|nr:gliding motility-associated C-terminal domain-containing protein [Bacteroidia bacterium]
MKKLYLALFIIFGFCSVNIQAQLVWDTTPTGFTLECNDDDNDADILSYLNGLVASTASCANDAIITWDYVDPGDFEDGDVITININAEDDCGVEMDLDETIDVTIEDTTPPTLDVPADDETEECDLPNNMTLLMNWINDHAGAEYIDECTDDPADFTWFTNPDPVALADLASTCGNNDGVITVDFWVEDEAGNSAVATTATFTLEDTTDPSFDDGPNAFDATFECDGMGNVADLTTWESDLLANILISDNCTDVADLMLVSDWDGTGFTDCDGPDIEVELTLTDECGMTETYIATASLEDTTDPNLNTAASDLVLVCDPSTNDTDIMDWLDLVGNAVFDDDCTATDELIISNDYSGTKPDCDGPGFETVTFTIEDECGNTVETSADIIIDDLDLPIIQAIDNNPPAIECVGEMITNGGMLDIINGIIASASATDVNDCTDPADLIWVFSPDPVMEEATVPDPDCFGLLAGDYIFDVYVEDECGNQSAVETVTITVEDTTNPSIPGTLPADATYDCADEIPPADNLFAPDDCESAVALFEETYLVENCDNQVEIERFWVFEDACGNSAGEWTQIVTVDDQEAPEWLGDEDDYLPEDIELVVANCDEGYNFPNGYYENEDTGEEWPIYPLGEGSEFEDNCQPVIFYQIGPPPGEQFGGGETCVTYIVEDACGNSITHEFCVSIICSNCVGGGVACLESCETVADGCHTCNIEELLDGFESCTPEYLGSVLDWPPSLCNGAGVPHNMSWFSFVAGGSDLCVEVAPNMCAMGGGPVGLQSGVYDFCEDDDGVCIGGDANCSSGLDEITYGISDLIVGNTYYLFVDGCNGAECDYEITIEKGLEFILDTPEEVVVEESCVQLPTLPPGTYCPETELQFDIWHAGDSPSDQGEYDSPGPYNPDLGAEFFWTFNPPINGMTDESWTTGEDGDGFTIPPLTFENVTVETTFEICLTDIEAECSDAECDDCCTFVTIAPLPDEFFGPYEVCVEDLLELGGWDPSIVGDDPNGDGIEWIGPDNITLEQVEDATDNDGISILTFEVFDPECGCRFNQSIQIIPIGNLEPIDVLLYMFDCQFRDEDGDLDSYIWEWPEDNYELTVEMEDFFFRIPEGSIIRDWENQRCDSLLLVTVDTAIVEGVLTQGPCTPTGTEYCFELSIDQLEDDHPEHPTINPDYFGMNWVNANTMLNAGSGPCFNVTPATAGPYFVEIEYSFIDGAYDETLQVVAECTKLFGPFDLDSGTAIPPVVEGDDLFCINDLTGKIFNVIDPVAGSTYDWTFPAGANGTVMNAPINDMIEVDFTDYDFAANMPILVIANTPCGISEAFEVYVQTIDLPVPDFTIVSPVCVGDLAAAEFNGDQTQISEYMWSSDNYNSGNQSGPGPVNYSASAAGTYTVSLVVVNNEGCVSEPVSRDFEVVAPLTAPIIDCSTTASSVGFTWLEVVGATGYEITVIQAPTGVGTVMTNTATELSVDFPGLSVNDVVEISVVAIGDAPCFNGPASSLECQALDCPDPDWIFNLWSDTSFCVSNLIDPFSFDVTGVNGAAEYSSPVVGAVDASGAVTPSAFPVGTTPVTLTYVYQNGDCMRSRTINVTVFAQPNATFAPSVSELCLGSTLTIDDSNVDDVATWDYGVDGSIDANGMVSWTSSGQKTISVSVLTPESCTNNFSVDVTVLDTLIMGEITCIDQDLDFVEFDWDDVVGATGYDISYTINGGAQVDENNYPDSDILIDNLMPDDVVVITVTALSPNQCPNVTRTADCVAISCTPLVFDNPFCTEEGIDYVLFEWDPVAGASMYEITINGTLIGIQDSTTYFEGGLEPGDIVSISVTALNDLDNCADVTRTRDCTAGDCPEATFTFTPLPDPCYNAAVGGLQLVDPVIDGVVGGGVGNWNSPFVDANGRFTPDDEMDMMYILEYEYVEGNCQYSDEIEVEIIIIPEGGITVSDDDICVTETTMVEATSVFNNNETAIWDWGTGVTAVGSGFGPYELSFDAAGTYVVTLTLDNEGCLSEPVTTSIEVDPELITPNINCTSSNSFVNWNWDDVEGVNQYSISIDGVFQTTQDNSDFRVDGLVEGTEVEITIAFITDSSCELADLVSPCTTGACPAAFFDLGNFTNEMCLDGSEMNVQLDIELLNGPPGETGVGSWSGTGVTANGLFSPSGLSGQDVELTYSIEFSECAYDTSINIVLFDAPQITAINPIDPDCYSFQFGGINPEVSGGTAPYTYTADNLPPQNFPAFIDILQPGFHTIEVTDANNCVTTQQLEIFAAVEPDIGIDGPLAILNTDTGEYTLNTNAQNIGDVIWLANGEIICEGTDCEPITILGEDYPDDVEITVQVFFNEDCFIETTVRVDVFDIQKYYIPNVISETADGDDNRNWAIYGKGSSILVKTVKVYDRWGELVHDQAINEYTRDHPDGRVELGWSGRWSEVGGQNVIAGVYVYLIELEVEGREVIEASDVTVLR